MADSRRKLIKLPEPTLLFGHGQAMEDPRDGLTLFGPLDEGNPYGIRIGVVGTRAGIERYKRWVKSIQLPIASDPEDQARPPFPGFQAAFRIPWNPRPTLELEVPDHELGSIYLDDKHQRVYRTVEVYASRIIRAVTEEEANVDVWFVVVSDELHKYCRPQSSVEATVRIKADSRMPVRDAQRLQTQPSLFAEINEAAIPYHYEVHFHNQLKARLLPYNAPTQVVRESTIAPYDFVDRYGRPKRDLDTPSAIAWNLSTAVFYKAGGRPWKLGSIRDGVCYIGVVFKRDDKHPDPKMACCAAQMFLDSGDGVVFKGAVGPWYNPESKECHLTRTDAKDLVKLAVESYEQRRGEPPKELFLHGKARFNEEEWAGFREAVSSTTNLVGIRIRHEEDLRLYGKGTHPVLRGLAYVRDERTAYLWTKGYIPRLQTYPGMEVPKPLLVDINKGEADIETVLSDILALTKLNYNSAIFADGEPVTLVFADAVGEILTAGPSEGVPRLPFKFYI